MAVRLYARTTLTLLLVLLVMRRAFYVLELSFCASGGRLTELFKELQLLGILQMEMFLIFSRARMHAAIPLLLSTHSRSASAGTSTNCPFTSGDAILK